MLRARNRRRRDQPRRRFSLPVINWLPLLSLVGAALLTGGVTLLLGWLIDRPITQVVIHGQFERVSADQLEALLRPHLGQGFLRMDLPAIQRELTALPWVGSARLSRRWPETLQLVITEQQAAARWGVNGLLNARGQLFIDQATHVPAGLPRLEGPEGSENRVAARFIALQEELVPRGLGVVALSLDERGAWSFTLANGIEVRLGSALVEERLALFYQAVDQVLGGIAGQVDYIDMRHANGFAIGWKPAAERAGGQVNAAMTEGVAG